MYAIDFRELLSVHLNNLVDLSKDECSWMQQIIY